MFLGAVEEWKDLKELQLWEGKLHEEGQVKLQQVLEVIKLEKLTFASGFRCPDVEAVRTFCKKQNIRFIYR